MCAHLPMCAQLTSKLFTCQANGVCGIGDPSLIALAEGCPELRKIDVRGCARVTEHGLSVIAKHLPSCRVYANTAAEQLS